MINEAHLFFTHMDGITDAFEDVKNQVFKRMLPVYAEISGAAIKKQWEAMLADYNTRFAGGETYIGFYAEPHDKLMGQMVREIEAAKRAERKRAFVGEDAQQEESTVVPNKKKRSDSSTTSSAVVASGSWNKVMVGGGGVPAPPPPPQVKDEEGEDVV